MTRTKIVATLGPASSTEKVIRELINSGVDVFRLNMSHGDHASHGRLIKKVRNAENGNGAGPAAILGDLCGPKIRVGRIEGGQAVLAAGSPIILTAADITGGPERLHVSYPALGKGMKRGMRVLLADGMFELKVLSAGPGEVTCKVVKGGVLKQGKGVNFPGLPLDLPSLTEKDARDLEFLLREGVDFIALSFVRQAVDVQALKERIKKAGKDTPVIAKIERPEAIKNLKEIIIASDGVMVARGDLGVEMLPELVPPLQKRIIKLCNAYKKPVITATQMLESMVWNPRPTRAEASDVAGAVFDGTDALMLSEETAAGEYPVASVLMMDRVAREAEKYAVFPDLKAEVSGQMEAVASSACRCAEELKAKAIICFTRSGATALLISKSRPPAAIIAATPDKRVMRKMRLYYGVIPVPIKLRENTDRIIKEVEAAALSRRLVREGDLVILTLGVPAADSPTNLMKIHRVGERFGKAQ